MKKLPPLKQLRCAMFAEIVSVTIKLYSQLNY